MEIDKKDIVYDKETIDTTYNLSIAINKDLQTIYNESELKITIDDKDVILDKYRNTILTKYISKGSEIKFAFNPDTMFPLEIVHVNLYRKEKYINYFDTILKNYHDKKNDIIKFKTSFKFYTSHTFFITIDQDLIYNIKTSYRDTVYYLQIYTKNPRFTIFYTIIIN